MMNKNKKGISPLIATVLIIGFTIVLAALVITWGTNLFKGAQERTSETADLNLACSDVISGLDVRVANVDETAGSFELTLDNGATRDINGFIVRVYSVGETSADTIDTETLGGDFVVVGSNLRTFPLSYSTAVVSDAVKIGVRPKVVIKGETQQCQGESEEEL